MAAKNFKAFRIANSTLAKLEERKTQLARGDSMTAFIGWVLALYAEGKLEEVKSGMATTGKLIIGASAEPIRKRNERAS